LNRMLQRDEELFEQTRPVLVRHAYRMTGSISDAEDIVHDAFLRWHGTDRTRVRDPRAYLRATVTHLALDRLRAQARSRETYVGPWLPEPVVTDERSVPDTALSLAEDVSMAFLLALQRLSPLERAAFLLHDALDVPFAEIATMLERSEESVRRLASRARDAIRTARPRRIAPPANMDELRRRFLAALADDDVSALAELLTEDVVLLSDGGGKRIAAAKPIVGREDVSTFVHGVVRKGLARVTELRPASVNGAPGWLVFTAEGIEQTLSFETDDAGRIQTIYAVRNPDKLGALVR
jgi:RNA polymerase sigma-70 factor (ECF subfamily)